MNLCEIVVGRDLVWLRRIHW